MGLQNVLKLLGTFSLVRVSKSLERSNTHWIDAGIALGGSVSGDADPADPRCPSAAPIQTFLLSAGLSKVTIFPT